MYIRWLVLTFIFCTYFNTFLPGSLLMAHAQDISGVKVIKYQVDNYYLPVVTGMENSHLEGRINKALWGAISYYHRPSHYGQLYGNFTVPFYNGNLLAIHYRGSCYNLRAAHPVYLDFGVHIDMSTGRVYELADLFLPGVDYVERIKQLCRDHQQEYRLNNDGLWNGWTYDTFANTLRKDMAADQFLLAEDSVRIYSMASQAAGYISGYRVPYSALDDIIDKNGELWKALSGNKAENIAEEIEKIQYDDFIVRDYNIMPGDYAKAILKRLGQAGLQEQTADCTSYDYGFFVLVVAGDQVAEISTNSKQVQTRRWAHVGLPLRLVLERYGEAAVSGKDGYVYYDYYYGTSSQKCVLRFAVKQGSDIVDNISWKLVRDQ